MGSRQVMSGRAITIIIVSAVLSALAILALCLRFLARRSKGGRYYLDDYLAVFALLITLGVTINNIVGASIAGIGSHEVYRVSGPAKGFPYPDELRPQGQVMFALQILHTCAMLAIKGSVLCFYLRLFPTVKFKRAVWGVGTYVVCWWISILFATIFQCKPISSNWGTDPSQTGDCIANINIMYETAALTNLLSDITILILPIPVVMGLHMRLKHKIAVMAVFLTGALVVVAGIGRTVAYFRLNYNDTPDFSYWYYPLVIWTSIEPTLGVISACLPTLRALFAGLSPESVLSSIRSVLSLRSLSRSQSRGQSPGETYDPENKTDQNNESKQYLPGSATAVANTIVTGAELENDLLPDPNAGRGANEFIAFELKRAKMRNEPPKEGIFIRDDTDLKLMHNVA